MLSSARLFSRLNKTVLASRRTAKLVQCNSIKTVPVVCVQVLPVRRGFSTAASEGPSADKEGSSSTEVTKYNMDEYDDYEPPQTAAEHVSLWTVVFLRIAFLVAGAACVGVLAKELFPGRLGPYRLFSEAFDAVKVNDEVSFGILG
jgi:hypothetical protein